MIPGSASPLLLGDGGQVQVSRSLRLRSSASSYLSRTLVTPTANTTWTYSIWLKRGQISTEQYLLCGSTSAIRFASGDTLQFVAAANAVATSSALFRDPSSHGHLVIRSNGTNIVAYFNNAQILSYTGTIPALNSAVAHYIGTYSTPGSYYDGLISEAVFVDGQALTPSSFAETDPLTGLWNPKRYSGAYGANGFYLNFSDNSAATATTIGKDFSGNGNNWTPTNISVTAGVTNDSFIDVPTDYIDTGNGRSNYATLNPAWGLSSGISNANLRHTVTGTNTGIATIGMTTGKWYCEMLVETVSTSCMIGLVSSAAVGNSYPGVASDSCGYYLNGNKYNSNSAVSFGAAYTTGDIIGMAYDADTGKLWFSKNNTWQASGVPSTGTSPAYTVSDLTKAMFFATGAAASGTVISANFGQQPFTYTPPTGFKALNTLNLPDPLIKLPNKYFDVTGYAGTGVAKSVSNAGAFAPDLVWSKSRSAASSNILADSTRGATIYFVTNSTSGEGTDATLYSAFNSDGFSIGTNSAVNTNAGAYVGTQWKKGSIPGFDIVSYTGNDTARSINHSLGAVPAMKIVKQRTGTRDWFANHKGMASTSYLLLDGVDAAASAASVFSGSDTSSVFNLGSNAAVNGGGTGYIAYLWSEVAGFSKFGSYAGNGSTDGPFVNCNFTPKYILIKRTDSTGGWVISDTTRSPSNVSVAILYANIANAEELTGGVDILSNGFKIRTTNTDYNVGGGTYIYMAFASNPFKYSRAR